MRKYCYFIYTLSKSSKPLHRNFTILTQKRNIIEETIFHCDLIISMIQTNKGRQQLDITDISVFVTNRHIDFGKVVIK